MLHNAQIAQGIWDQSWPVVVDVPGLVIIASRIPGSGVSIKRQAATFCRASICFLTQASSNKPQACDNFVK